MWSKLAFVACVAPVAAFVGPRPARHLAPSMSTPQDKLQDAAKQVQEKLGDLDLDSAKAFGTKNLDVLKNNQERAVVDLAAAGFSGLLFAGVYGAAVFALGWFAAAPSTDAYNRPADSYGACIETALPGAAVGALVGMLLTVKIFSVPTDVFAVLVSVVVISSARAGKLYLDTKAMPSADDLTSVNVGSLKWPSL
jgi:hypothetical protein